MFAQGFNKIAVSYEWINKKFVSGLNKRMDNIPSSQRAEKEKHLGEAVEKHLKSNFKDKNHFNSVARAIETSNGIRPGSAGHKLARSLNNIARHGLPKKG